MSQDENQYTLIANELGAVRQCLKLQKMIGHDVVPSPGFGVVNSFMDGLDALSVVYPSLSNSTFKGWVDQLFSSLIATNTCHNCGFADLCVAYSYGQYIDSIGGLDRPGGVPPSDGYNYYVAFSKGLQADPDRYLGPWKEWGTGNKKDWAPAYPQSPPQWVAAVNAVFAAWGDNPPAKLIDKGNGPDYDRVQPFERKLVSTDWTDFNKVQTNTAGVWKLQMQTASSLLQPASLTGDAYFFLLHLLIALATGDTACLSLVQHIINAATNSPEYPNDTFINQLVYLSLMHLADPLGPFGWNNQQLQGGFKDLDGSILGQDPASVAVRKSIEAHRKILYSDSAYPMQDPYSPDVGFSQRKTDTLFALDQARQACKPK
jgi:hypothetical protein